MIANKRICLAAFSFPSERYKLRRAPLIQEFDGNFFYVMNHLQWN